MGVQTLQIDISVDNKKAIAGVSQIKQSVFNLKEELLKYQSLAFTEKDQQKVTAYNRRIQELQTSIKQTTNVGKEGFDAMGIAIGKSGNPLTKAFSGLRSIAYILPGIGIAGIFNLAFEAIGKAAKELELFSSKISQAEKNIKNLNDVQKEASKTAGEDITKARLLYQATTDVNLSMRERLKAAQELKNEYPELLKNFSNETIAAGGAKTAYDKLTDSIIANAKAKAAAAKIAEIQAKIFEAEFKAEKIRNALSNEISRTKDTRSTDLEGNSTITTAAQQRAGAFVRANKGFAELKKQIGEYVQEQKFLEDSIGKQNLEKQAVGLDKTPGLDKTTKEQDALKELSKTLGQIQHQYAKRAIDNDQYNKESIKAYDVALGKLDATSKKYDELIIKQGEYLRGNKIRKEDTVQSDLFTLDALKKQLANRLKPDADYKDPFAAPKHINDSGKFGSGIFDEDFSKMAAKKKQDIDDYNSSLKTTLEYTNLLGDAFYNAIVAGENLGDTLKNVFADLAKQIGKALIKAILFKAIGGALSGGSSLGFSEIFANFLGIGKGFAKGGLSTGPQSGHMELLHGNEWVLRPEQLSGALDMARNSGRIAGSLGNGSVSQSLPVPSLFMKGSDFWLMYQQSQRLNQRSS